MSGRIGEALIDKGLITATQLQDALKTQLFFGGHLGTSLIELGYVAEDDLGETLAECLRVRYAPFDLLKEIPDDVIARIPPELAEKRKIVPIKFADKALHVAAIDPQQLGAVSVATGYKIVPWIAAETRIYQALEKYYRIPQRPRHIRILSDLEKTVSGQHHVVGYPGERRGAQPPAAVAGVGTAQVPRATENEGLSLSPMMDAGEQYGYGRSWREVLEEVIEEDNVSWEKEDDRGRRRQPAALNPGDDVDAAGEMLSRIETKDQLSEIALSYCSARLKRVVLFRVKAETAYIWETRGLDRRAAQLKRVGFPLTAGSVFTLLLGEDHFHGRLKDPQRFEWFYTTLGVGPPREVLLVPVYLNDRLVALLYGDGGKRGRIKGETEDFLRLCQKIGLTMNMLIQKMRIRSI